MNKKGQLGLIEFRYFIYGLIAGILVGLVLIILLRQGTFGMQIPFLSCPVK